jgi:glycosyltransferase involved in cell wall biosynthesis
VSAASLEPAPASSRSLEGVKVTLVLPCLNEEAGVGACVSAALRVFSDAGLQGTVLVVDNGSTDDSVRVALDAGARVFRQEEPGYGAALRSGIEAAETEFVVMADADGTYELEAIPRLLGPLLDDKADLVMGSRRDAATMSTMPLLHRFVGTPVLTNLVNRAAATRTKVKDSQSGFRAFRRSEMIDLGLTATGMEFATEMLIRSSWARLRIVEVPTTYRKRIGESKLETFPDGMRHLRQILLLSPEAYARDPAIAMMSISVLFWGIVLFATQGQGNIGSSSWIGLLIAEVFAIMGPLTYCTGLVLKYRAESLGLRHSPPKRTIKDLVWRFCFVGLGFLAFTMGAVVVLALDFHDQLWSNLAFNRVLSSMAGCAAVVGIVLTLSPLISPLLLQAPVRQLPAAVEVESADDA